MKIKKTRLYGSILLEAVTALLVLSITTIALLVHINIRLQALTVIRERLNTLTRMKKYIAQRKFVLENGNTERITCENFTEIESGSFLTLGCTKVTLTSNSNNITLVTGIIAGEI